MITHGIATICSAMFSDTIWCKILEGGNYGETVHSKN